jgi:hypothetical protein
VTLHYLLMLIDLVRAALRGRSDLLAENLLLRQQLMVLTRPTRKRPRLASTDRLFWVGWGTSCRSGAATWSSCSPGPSSAGTRGRGGSGGGGDPGARSADPGSVPRRAS